MVNEAVRWKKELLNVDTVRHRQRMQATNQRSQAAMARANASAINPAMAFGTSLIGSAGNVAESWYRFKGSGNTSGGTLGDKGDPIWGLYQLNNGWR